MSSKLKTSPPFTPLPLGSLTCQPPLPDIPPQQIPSLGRGVPQLLADRPPQLQLGGASLARHCGVARAMSPPTMRRQRSASAPLFLRSPVISLLRSAGGGRLAGTQRAAPPPRFLPCVAAASGCRNGSSSAALLSCAASPFLHQHRADEVPCSPDLHPPNSSKPLSA